MIHPGDFMQPNATPALFLTSAASHPEPHKGAALAAQTTDQLVAAQQAIRLSPLAKSLVDVPAWRAFMRLHVFAVWDFMSLLKRLQRELTSVDLPWMPKVGGTAARFVNEIVLAEESDADGSGGYCSHFELYGRAMRQAGADVTPIKSTLAALQRGETIDEALAGADVPLAVRAFVRHTVAVATKGSLVEVAGNFLYGREAVLPHIFVDLLDGLTISDPCLTTLAYYLRRHIEVDGDEHGPMAQALLLSLCGDDEALWREAHRSAARSLALRADLWQAIFETVGTPGF
jgi:hypothetical protein